MKLWEAVDFKTFCEFLFKVLFYTFLNGVGVSVLADLGADSEVQEVWLSAVFPLNVSMIVPMETIRRQIRSHFGRIVERRYPDLVNNGTCSAIIHRLCSRSKYILRHSSVILIQDVCLLFPRFTSMITVDSI